MLRKFNQGVLERVTLCTLLFYVSFSTQPAAVPGTGGKVVVMFCKRQLEPSPITWAGGAGKWRLQT
jgi:hypothetical protein